MDKIVIDDSELRVTMAWVTVVKPTFKATMNTLVQKGIVKNMAQEDDSCYKCGQKGHWSVICPNPSTYPTYQNKGGYNYYNKYKDYNKKAYNPYQQADSSAAVITDPTVTSSA